MRCTFRIPGFGQYSVVPWRTSALWRLLITIFLFVCGFIVYLTISESLAISRQQSSANEMHRSTGILTDIKPTNSDDDTLNYGILVDCGSSGSRVFVYFWPPHSGKAGHLLNIQLMRDSNSEPVIKKVEPGLSTYVDHPSDASDHIAPLLRFAASHIPPQKHKESPVYIMATAGLRMLEPTEQEAILNDLRTDINLEFEFLFSPTHVEVISGKQEGIYSWIAVNYVLGKFDHKNNDDKLIAVEVSGVEKLHIRKRTVGIMDLGGASLQLAFELPQSIRLTDPQDKGFLAEFSLGCSSSDIDHVYRIYVATFLGFGSNVVRSRYKTTLVENYISSKKGNYSSPQTTEYTSPVIPDPCLPPGKIEDHEHNRINYRLSGQGNLTSCVQSVNHLLNRTSCKFASRHCSIDGLFLPNIDFKNSEFYGFSEFFYTMEDILQIGGKYNHYQFQQSAREYCSTHWSEIESWRNNTKYPRADYNRYLLQCFKSSWLLSVLHDGLGFPHRYHHFTSLQYVEGQEVHWTLGAILYKTKYFPLREIEKQRSLLHQKPSSLIPEFHTSYYLLAFCTVVVLLAICLYMLWLRFINVSHLHRVPSMAYYMVDSSQREDGIRFDRSKSYSSFFT